MFWGLSRLELILVRHGKPAVRPDLAGDPPLCAEGERQAAWTAARLAGEAVQRIVASGMIRARETARPLGDALGLPIAVEPLLGEVDRVTGRYASIEMVRAQGEGEWARFLAGPLAYFGVDAAQFRADVLEGFRNVLAGGVRTVVYTHGFPINLLLAHALGLPDEARFVPAYGSVTRLRGHSLHQLVVMSVNETAHFPQAVAP